MRYTLSQKIGHLARVLVAWIAAYSLFAFIRFYGTTSEESVAEQLWSTAPHHYFYQLLTAALITGLLFGIVDLVMDRPRFQRWSFWKLIAVKGSLHFLIIIITLTVMVLSRVQLGIVELEDLHMSFGDIVRIKSIQVFALFFTITTLLLSGYQQVNQKFGKGVLLDMMLGRYHRPQEADRILMFIDLKSSVRIAEELGHIKYSLLLQDCYFDLNTQLSRYKAKIYQYVGDEVVLHWSPEDGLDNSNCIRCFVAFIRRLESRKLYYINKYGIMPYFKAGGHMGRVTVAEVGVLKRSIAFHGDTVNTTSRIHDQCNNYNQQLLVSRDLLSRLIDKGDLKYVYIGDEILKGKHRKMELYGIQKVIDRAVV